MLKLRQKLQSMGREAAGRVKRVCLEMLQKMFVLVMNLCGATLKSNLQEESNKLEFRRSLARIMFYYSSRILVLPCPLIVLALRFTLAGESSNPRVLEFRSQASNNFFTIIATICFLEFESERSIAFLRIKKKDEVGQLLPQSIILSTSRRRFSASSHVKLQVLLAASLS